MLLNEVGKIYDYLDRDSLEGLERNGIRTVSEFLVVEPQNIVSLCSAHSSEKTYIWDILELRKLLFTCYAPFAASGWYVNQQTKANILLTNLKALDKLLNGGFKGGYIYEVYGLPGSGRTQFALFLTLSNCKNGGNTLYIDTKNDFCVDRFCEISKNICEPASPMAKRPKTNCDEHEELLEKQIKKVEIAKVFEMASLLDIMCDIVDKMGSLTGENDLAVDEWKFYRDTRLIVIDNLASLVLPMLGNDCYTMNEVTGYMNQFTEKARQVANEHNLIILIVNNSTYTSRGFKNNDSKDTTRPGSFKPSLGKLFSETANVRLRIDYGTSADRKTKCKSNWRKVILEKDTDSQGVVRTNLSDVCLLSISSNGLEEIQ